MGWWGTIIGGAFGFMLGGPLGALLGAALGRNFDHGLGRLGDVEGLRVGDQQRVQSAFFTAVFSVMGYVAKADGRVSEEEIELARSVMAQMNLSAEMKRTAIRLFTEGKAADFPLDDVLTQFRRECRRRHNLMQMFIEIQIHAAYADGEMTRDEQRVLLQIGETLGFSRHEFEHLDAIIKAQRHAAGEGQRPAQTSSGFTLRESYEILDINPNATDAEVKRAYRRLMNQHHPDKLIAKGLPEEMMQIATEKTQEIKAAYEQIKAARGMR